MKKIIAILAVAVAAMSAAFSAKAIEDPWAKGTMVAGAQFGFLPGIGGSAYGDYVLVDSWWKGHFTVGGELLYWHQWPEHDGYKNHFHNLGIAARATYGLNISDKFEVHAGLFTGVGVNFGHEWPKDGKHSDAIRKNATPIFLSGGVAGVRYFLTENLAASAEIQLMTNLPIPTYVRLPFVPLINLGVAYKF